MVTKKTENVILQDTHIIIIITK